jgi:hypothetical protein
VVLVGRRTTYGGPFRDIDRLSKGDRFTVTTSEGSFSYVVSDVHRYSAGQADPLNGTVDSRLTLITSDPAYLPDGRLAVVAKLRGEPIAVPNRPMIPISSDELGLAGDPLGLGLAALWAALLGAAIFLTWWTARNWPARVRYLFAAPILIALAVLLFSSLDRMLPSAM